MASLFAQTSRCVGHRRPLLVSIKSPLQKAPTLRVPFILFTNGGGYTEEKKSLELSELLKIKLSSDQVFLSHTSFKELASCYRDKRTLAVGKGEPAQVLRHYGFMNVVAMDDYVCEFESIDPLEQYKPWSRAGSATLAGRESQDVQAVFIVSDPVDWGRDIQVVSDVLNGGGNPLKVGGKAPPLYFAADDLIYQSAFPVVRYGMGAFRIALESVYTRLTGMPMVYTSFGKPKPATYKLVRKELEKLAGSVDPLQTIYMVGDNPATDIRGAKEAGKPWFSILVRTGCFRGINNDEEFPADEVVDNIVEAVDFILKREGLD
ncbi:hypothetical protein SELMODRAFT_184925 [Selaginella moellendorffii]|uniref:Uncharacterized protein n=1 Tax=Selaginella moellendorffii TaxID=88036 RepID=D8T2Y6_SELML|nr:uncharacterized CDP-alcohol phosphatidyltransferase class-I family protein C22A12.08c isoform X2 [Selaginella moellendorffii]EFJ08934.1 hypothetical protein SELMODRAFT_184925 [Selaginella moellendorffii]|eukprot:XP_002989921.1 uncharacterized CDP-alcohol phosphatidyltransferase class-I family protein C22A12.08c isoform X2 [Selaginella moellendorffii]